MELEIKASANSLLPFVQNISMARSIGLLLLHLHGLYLTYLSPIKEKVFLKTLDFKGEKLEKY